MRQQIGGALQPEPPVIAVRRDIQLGAEIALELAAGVAEWFVHSPLRSSVDRKLMPLRLRTASTGRGTRSSEISSA
ncbi:MAG: hypothetical protein E5X01_18530, partial [Mesorhizobium sp.]